MTDQLSETTKTEVEQLASDIEPIKGLTKAGEMVLHSPQYGSLLPFDWVDRLEEIVDAADAPRSYVVGHFLERVSTAGTVDVENTLIPILEQMGGGDGYGEETAPIDSTAPDLSQAEQFLQVGEEIKQIRPLEADGRGRVNLGRDFANETVRVAVLETVED